MEESVKLIDILSKHYPHIFGFVFAYWGSVGNWCGIWPEHILQENMDCTGGII